MFGFFIGTACLIGLFAVARGGRGHRWRHHHGAQFALHRVLDRLDTTPGQEKTIREAVRDFAEEASELRLEVSRTRKDMAEALRSDSIDHDLLQQVFQKHDTLLARLREAFVRSAEQAHATLDQKQREKFANIIEAGSFGYGRCH